MAASPPPPTSHPTSFPDPARGSVIDLGIWTPKADVWQFGLLAKLHVQVGAHFCISTDNWFFREFNFDK